MRLSATNARPTTAVAASRHCSATTTSPPSSSTTSLVHCRRRLPLSARAASLPVLPPLVTSMQRSCGRVPTKGAGRRIVSVSATPEAEASRPASASPAAARPPPPLVGALAVDKSLDDRISSGEFTDAGSTKERASRPVRKFLAKDPVGPGRAVALWLAQLGIQWRTAAASRMPTATGDIREIVGQPVFVPLYRLFLTYGKIFRLAFGPKVFIVVSDPELTKQVLVTDAANYSKGLLSEILDFVMGQGLIPADGEVWRERRRAVVPALHRRYIESMLGMFGDSALHGASVLERKMSAGGGGGGSGEGGAAAASSLHHAPPSSSSGPSVVVEIENFFSRLTLDIIGKAVFNYDFDSLKNDDPFIQAVYTALREAEYRSTAFVPYWNFAPLRWLVPRQRRCQEALTIINSTLDGLIAECQRLVDSGEEEFVDEFLSDRDPSILHFLLAAGDTLDSKQLRDDLMTLLVAGHETTAAVLTWTVYCLISRPEYAAKVAKEVDEVLGDRAPTLDDMPKLRWTTRVINESMRLYPQPPVLIRRAAVETKLGGFVIPAGSDLFLSVWNLHRDPQRWKDADNFIPERFGPVDDVVVGGGEAAGTSGAVGCPRSGAAAAASASASSSSSSYVVPNEITESFSYLPFGGGKRKCIGDQFALFESVSALAVFARRFDFALAEGAPPVGMTTGATIHTSGGLMLRLTKREHGGKGGGGGGAETPVSAEAAVVV